MYEVLDAEGTNIETTFMYAGSTARQPSGNYISKIIRSMRTMTDLFRNDRLALHEFIHNSPRER